MRVTMAPIVVSALGMVFEGLERGLEQLDNRFHPDYSIVEIGQNTDKSPGDLKWLAVTQASVKAIQLTLVWKTHSEFQKW